MPLNNDLLQERKKAQEDKAGASANKKTGTGSTGKSSEEKVLGNIRNTSWEERVFNKLNAKQDSMQYNTPLYQKYLRSADRYRTQALKDQMPQQQMQHNAYKINELSKKLDRSVKGLRGSYDEINKRGSTDNLAFTWYQRNLNDTKKDVQDTISAVRRGKDLLDEDTYNNYIQSLEELQDNLNNGYSATELKGKIDFQKQMQSDTSFRYSVEMSGAEIDAKIAELTTKKKEADDASTACAGNMDYVGSQRWSDKANEYAAQIDEYNKAKEYQTQNANAERISSILDNDTFRTYLADMEKTREKNPYWRTDYYTDKIFGGEHLVRAFGTKAAYSPKAAELTQKVADNEADYMTAIDWCTDTELTAFRYIWEHGTAEDVVVYLDAIKADALEQEHKYASELLAGSTLMRFITSAASVPLNIYSGLEWLGNEIHGSIYGKGENQLLGAKLVSEIRGANAEKLTEKGLFNTGLMKGDWNLPDVLPINSLGDAYQLGMSIVDSQVGANIVGGISNALALGTNATKALEAAFTVSLGTSAGASKYNEVMANGGTLKQAMTASFTSALIEAGTEFVSLDHLVNPDKMKSFWQNVLQQSAIEGSEELFATLGNGVTDWITAYFNGGNYSEMLNLYRDLKDKGYSDDKAVLECMTTLGTEMMSDMFGGMISGAAGMGLSMTTSGLSYRGSGNQRIYNKNETAALKQFAADNGLTVDLSKQSDIRKIGNKFTQTVANELMNAANITEAEEIVSKYTETYGNDIRKNVTEAYKNAVDKQFSVAATAEALDDAYAKFTENAEAINGGSSDLLRAAAQAYSKRAAQIEAGVKGATEESIIRAAAKPYTGVHGHGSLNTEVTLTDADGNQTSAQIKSMDASGQLVLDNDSTVSAKDADVRSDTRAALNYCLDIGGKDGAALFNAYLEVADQTSIDGYAYVSGMYEAYQQGLAGGESGWQAAFNKRGSKISENVHRFSYLLGADHAAEVTEQQREKINREIAKFGEGATGRVGSVSWDANVDVTTKNGKRAQTLGKVIAQAVGVDVRLVKGSGKIEGSYQNGVLTLDIDQLQKRPGETVQAAILRVASHELTHFIQDKNSGDYKALKNFCFNHILEAHTQEEIDRQREEIIRSNEEQGKKLSPEDAIDEMVANACEQILTNSDILIELYKQNASLAERVQIHVSEFFAKLRENIGKAVKVKEAAWMSDAMDELQEKWEAALRVAADNQIKLNSVEGTKNTATEGGKIRYSMAGQNAEYADMSALDKAKTMESENASSEEIRQQTGWFKGYDGKWRFEIDDSLSKWKDAPAFEIHEDDDMVYRTAKLGNLFKHDKLFKAYPQLADITVVVQPMDFYTYGTYSTFSNSISLSSSLFEVKTESYSKFLNGGRAQRIAEIESTPEYQEYHKFFDDDAYDDLDAAEWLKREKEAQDKFFSSDLGKEYYDLQWGDAAKYIGTKYQFGFTDEGKSVLLHELQHAVQKIEGFAKGSNTSYENYEKTAGEIEARDVQARRNLSTEERRKTRPDIDRTDVAFAEKNNTKTSATSPLSGSPAQQGSVGKTLKSVTAAAENLGINGNIAQFSERVKNAILSLSNISDAIKNNDVFNGHKINAGNFVWTLVQNGILSFEGTSGSAYRTDNNHTLRVSNHSSNANNFETSGENLSIVLLTTNKTNYFVADETKNVIEAEFKKGFLNKHPAVFSNLVKDIARFVVTGEYTDTAGAKNIKVSGSAEFIDEVKARMENSNVQFSVTLGENALDIGEAEQISDEELLWKMRLEDAPDFAKEDLKAYQQLVSERNDLQRKLKAIEADAEEKTGISAMNKRQLQAKIRQLENQVKQAREQTKRTAAKREARLKNIDAASVIHSVTDAIANESSLKRYAKEELHQLYSDVLALTDNGKEAAAQELLQNGATQLAGRIFNQLQVENDADVQIYDDIKSFMNKQSIRVSPEIMRDIAGPRQEDWNGYRAANGQRIVVTNGDTNIEDLYQQLAEIAPTIFDDQTYNLSDMADRIVSVLKYAYNTSTVIPFTEMSDYSDEQYDYYVGKLYAAILEDFKGRATPIAQTVADRIENELQEKYGIQISELQAELKQQKDLKQKAEKAAAAARNANGNLVSKKHALDRQLAARDAETAAWKSYWSDINDTLRKYQNRTERMEARNAALSEQNAQMKEDMRTLRAMDIAAEKATESKHKAEVAKLQRQIAGLETRMNKMLTKNELRTVVADERAKAAKEMAAHKDQVMQNYRERKKRTELIHKIGAVRDALQKRFTNPGENTYIPIGLANSIIDVIDMIDAAPADMRTVRGEQIPSKTAAKYRSANEAMQAVYEQYEELQKNKDFVWASEYDKETADQIKELVKQLNETVSANENGQYEIRELSNKDLQAVYDTLRGVTESLRNATKLMAQDSRISVYQAMEKLVDETLNGRRAKKNMQKPKGNRAGELTNLNVMRAALLMSNMKEDAQLYKMWKAIEAGDELATRYVMDYNKRLEKLKSGRNEMEYLNALNKQVDFGIRDADGRAVKMTKMQLLQAMMTWEREAHSDKLKHIERGFMEIRDAKALARGDIELANRKAQIIRFDAETFEAMQKHLTEWDRSFMKAVREYLSGTEVGAVNKVMYVLKHRTINGEEFYFPVFTDRAYLSTELEGKQDATQLFVKAPGSTKALQTNAATPIIIDGLDTVMSRHVQEIANYVGLALPIRDFAKVYNARQTSEEGVARMSAKKAIERAWGNTANNILENNIRDVQKISRAARDNSTTTKLAGKLQSVMVRSALVGRVSVVIKQAASYLAAGSVITDRALLKHEGEIIPIFLAPGSNAAQKLFAEIDAHTSLHYNRRLGMSMQEIAEEKQKVTGVRKVASYAGAWLEQSSVGHAVRNAVETLNIETAIQRMDVATTAALWNACKSDVNQDFRKAKQKTGTEEYWAEVTRRYEKAIRETQPMYDPLHRTEESKSKSLLTATLGLFKTVPYQNKGQIKVAMAALEEANATGTKQEKQAAFNHAAKTVWANTHSAVVFSLLTLLSQALRHKMKKYRDEDDELTAESVTLAVLKDTMNVWASNISPIWGGLATELADRFLLGNTSAYDVFSAGAIDVLNDSATQATKLYKTAGDLIEGNASVADLVSQIEKTLLDAANYAGVPAENVWDMLSGISDNINDIKAGLIPAFNNANEKTDAVNAKRFSDAILSSDKDKANAVYHEMWKAQYDKYKSSGMSDSGASEAATKASDNAVKDHVKKLFVAGTLAEAGAKSVLSKIDMSDNDIYWTLDEWTETEAHKEEKKRKEWSYKKYHVLHDAIDTGKLNLEDTYGYYEEHGIERDDVKSEITRYVKELFGEGTIDRTTAEKYLTQWTEKDADDAYWKVDAWEGAAEHEHDEDYSYAKYGDLHAAIDSGSNIDAAVKELTAHGVSENTVRNEIRGYVKDSYNDGTMKTSAAVSALKKYGNMTDEEAKNRVQYWDFQKHYPDADISEEKVAAYYDNNLTVPMKDYVTYCTKAKDCHGVDANGDGKTDSGSKKAAIMKVIDALPISNAKKDELYYLNGWAASTIYEAPWH